MASGVVQGHVEFVTESGVVSVVATCYRVVELGEWSGVRCRDLPEGSGATQNPLQRVEQVVAVVMTCQRVRICRLELDWDV